MPILKHFEYEHLPEDLKEVSKKFHDLAHDMVDKLLTNVSELYHNPELEAGLRKLLEAKDCFVRAAIEFREL